MRSLLAVWVLGVASIAIAQPPSTSLLGDEAAPSTFGTISVSAVPVGVGSEVEIAALVRAIEAQNARLVLCYETARHVTPTLSGSIVFDGRLLVSGAITHVLAQSPPAELRATADCMGRVFGRVHVAGSPRSSEWPIRVTLRLIAPSTAGSGFGQRTHASDG